MNKIPRWLIISALSLGILMTLIGLWDVMVPWLQ